MGGLGKLHCFVVRCCTALVAGFGRRSGRLVFTEVVRGEARSRGESCYIRRHCLSDGAGAG